MPMICLIIGLGYLFPQLLQTHILYYRVFQKLNQSIINVLHLSIFSQCAKILSRISLNSLKTISCY